MIRARPRAPGWWRWLAAQPLRSSLATFVLGVALAVAWTIAWGWPPVPRIQDEFVYLLGADTFMHGRLTNAPHPLWQHFESFQLLVQPTYASKYPPAQSLFLALGTLLTGWPIAGVWLSYGLMCAALTWMLRPWVGPRWALWGGVFAAFLMAGGRGDPDLGGYWTRTYWGGAVAGLGGAIVYGALRRVVRRPRVGMAVVLGLGLVLLANSRPYEGLMVSLVPAVVLLRWLARGPGVGHRVRTVALPIAAVLAVAAVGMARYNERVTGSATRMPYMEYEAQYASTPFFAWLSRGPLPAYRHPTMREFYTRPGWMNPLRGSGMRVALAQLWDRAQMLRRFYLPLLAVPLVMAAPFALRTRWARVAFVGVTVPCVAVLAATWAFGHYAAPGLAPLLILLVLGAWRLRRLAARRPAWVSVHGAVLAGAIAAAALGIGTAARRQPARAQMWEYRRAAIARDLAGGGGRHLVLVGYGPRHRVLYDWVYNGADIDGAPVVWARAMDAEADARLVAHFQGRSVWRLVVDDDAGPFTLVPVAPAVP